MQSPVPRCRRSVPIEVALLVALAVLPLATCHDERGGKLSTGLDRGLQLRSLGVPDRERLCRAVQLWQAGSVTEPGCRASAWTAAATSLLAGPGNDLHLQASCSAEYDRCTQERRWPGETGDCLAGLSCPATVGELESCLGELAGRLYEASRALPACERLTRAALNERELPAVTLAELPACQPWLARCPGLRLLELGRP